MSARAVQRMVLNITKTGHKHQHQHNHDHYGSYADGNNHRTFHEKNPDNSLVKLTQKGYGNDVMKYIKEHNMETLTKLKSNSSDVPSIKYQNTSTTTSKKNLLAEEDENILINSLKNHYDDYYNYEYNFGTYNDPFKGYQLQEDEEYYSWEK